MDNEKTITKVRDSGIELLRIILMLQVIYLHLSAYGKYSAINVDLGGVYELGYWVQQTLSRCAVYVYIIISGYFSVTSKATIKTIFPKAKTIYFSAIFYSLLITVVLGVTGFVSIGKFDIIKSFFPITSKTWYFISTYLLVLILSPVVNLALTRLSKQDYKILLVVLFFLFSIWQMAANFEPFNEIIGVKSVIEATKGRGLYGFLFMYIVGGYIRLHVKPAEKLQWQYLALYLGLAVLDIVLVYAVKGVPILEYYRKIVHHNNAPIAIIQGIFLFMFFRSMHFKSKFINKVASHNLGVYMIHEHWLMRKVIWNKIFVVTKNPAFYSSPIFLVKIYGIILIIYIACVLIDICKDFIFKGIAKTYEAITKKEQKDKS